MAYAWGRFDTDETAYGNATRYGFTSDEFAAYYADVATDKTLHAAWLIFAAANPVGGPVWLTL
jgi:hypothetical protein